MEKVLKIKKANHPYDHPSLHQPPYSTWLTTLGMVVHGNVASLESLKGKIRGEFWGDNHFSTTIQANKDNNHFNFLEPKT